MDDTPYPKRPLRKRLLSLVGFSLVLLGLILLPVYIAYVAKHESYLPNRGKKTVLDTTKKSDKPSPKPTLEFSYHLPVLTYHYIRKVENPDTDPLGFRLSVTPDDFDAQMKYLAEHGYTTLTPEAIILSLKNKKPLPPKSVLLTFDDGYQDFYTNALPVLKKYNLNATLYVVSQFVSDKAGRYITWDQLREINDSGLVSIGSHTRYHVNVATHKNAELEIIQSKKELETFLGHTVLSFAYPGGTFNDTAAQIVKKAGYELAFTTQIGTEMKLSTRYTLPRVRVSGGLPIDQFPLKLLSIKAQD